MDCTFGYAVSKLDLLKKFHYMRRTKMKQTLLFTKFAGLKHYPQRLNMEHYLFLYFISHINFLQKRGFSSNLPLSHLSYSCISPWLVGVLDSDGTFSIN